MRSRFAAVLLVASLLIGANQAYAGIETDGFVRVNNIKIASISYPDVASNHWARSYIEKLSDKGVIAGYSNGKFKPEGFVTRAEFSKMLVLAAGITAPSTATPSTTSTASTTSTISFPDVPQGLWAAGYIDAAKSGGIIGGYKDGTFRPGSSVTRAEIAKMIMLARSIKRAAGVKHSAAVVFNDINGHWASAHISGAQDLGIIDGYPGGLFAPNRDISRAEVAKILVRAFADILGVQITNPGVPRIAITSPTAGNSYSSSNDSITLGGTASDDQGVTEISWTNSRGGKGDIKAGSTWTSKDIALQQGTNIITVIAADANGSKGTDSIIVTYATSAGSGSNSNLSGENNTESPSIQTFKKKVDWADEQAFKDRILSVDMEITNEGPGIAFSPVLQNVTATNNVKVKTVQQPSGDIAPKTSQTITVTYEVPVGVTSFEYKFDLICKDSIGNIYIY